MFTVGLRLTNMRVSDFKMDMDGSRLAIANDAIQVQVNDVSLHFDLDFNLASEPEFVADKGIGSIKLLNFNVTVDLKPVNTNGALQLEFIDAFIQVEDYTVHFDGQTDISKALELLMAEFKDFFKNEVVNMIARRMLVSVQDVINDHIQQQNALNVWNDDMPVFLNMKLSADPLLKDGSMMLPFDGGLSAVG